MVLKFHMLCESERGPGLHALRMTTWKARWVRNQEMPYIPESDAEGVAEPKNLALSRYKHT